MDRNDPEVRRRAEAFAAQYRQRIEAQRAALEPFFTPFHRPNAIDDTFMASKAHAAIDVSDLSAEEKARFHALAEQVANSHNVWSHMDFVVDPYWKEFLRAKGS